MKKIVLILVCAFILSLGLSFPAGSEPRKPDREIVFRDLSLYMPGNCTAEISQKVSDSYDEISVIVSCEDVHTGQTVGVNNVEKRLESQGYHGKKVALLVQAPYDYRFLVDNSRASTKILIVVQKAPNYND